MAATQTTNNNSIRSILEKEKLNGSNFLDWYRNLRIVLRNEQKLHHLEEALPEVPPATATAAVRNAYTHRVAEQQEVACLMLQQAEQELFETVKAFHACKQEEGQPVSTYVLKIKAYLDQMERLGYPMPLVLGVNLILTSLSKDYDYTRQGKTKRQGKSKLAYDPMHKIPPPAKKEHPAKDTECHHCHKTGHWKRNCPLYLTELKKNKARASGTSGIFMIELFSFPKSNTWIYDTSCGTHIYNTIQGLRGYQKLNKGALDLYVGNGNTATVEAIGSFDLILPSGMILVLDNCHFSSTITRGVISLSCLWDNGFRHKFINKGTFSVSKDNIVYFNAFPRDDIFEIDMHNHMSNERSIYTCSNKKTKHNLDYTFLWHCRLGYINKKHIMKLPHDGLHESIDDESFDVCVSCISGKMARKPFTHASERANELLGIIHSDVCGPFRTTSREESAARILNMVPTKKVNKTPYEMWHGKVPNLSYLKVWGCEALVKRDTPNKLESRSIKCIFVGYPKETMGYYFYYPLENKIFVARYAEFFKTNLIKQEASGSTVDFDEIQSEDAQPSENTSLHQHEVEHDTVEPQTDVIPVRRSARIPQAPERYGFYIDAEEHELGDHGEPPNYRAALSDPESEKWLEAMNAEMQSMKDNQVWNLVDLPPNCKTVGSKWLFKKKTDMDGNIHTYKARLVAKGFTQTVTPRQRRKLGNAT
ncbi:retrotransposon protein, putative, ty1-copia subclass [Tanacetum coccineum]